MAQTGNIFTLSTDKRWKAVIEHSGDGEPQLAEHCFEEISELHLIIERGPAWNRFVRCTISRSTVMTTMNRTTSYACHPPGGARTSR